MPLQKSIERIEELLKDCSERGRYLPKNGLGLALSIIREEVEKEEQRILRSKTGYLEYNIKDKG